MHFKFLGSGGVYPIPSATCNCKICAEARIKGFPYKRTTQSLFLYDIYALFDTPDCINEQLNTHSIEHINNIFYTHFHPDHTMGYRIIEILHNSQDEIINVYMPENKINISINSFQSVFDYLESKSMCKIIHNESNYRFGNIRITRVPLNCSDVQGYLIQQHNKSVFFCPCHAKYIPLELESLYNIDVMILGIGYLKYMNNTTTHFESDILKIIDNYAPKKTLLTHLEEIDKLSFDDYLELEKKYSNKAISFAYDGMDLFV